MKNASDAEEEWVKLDAACQHEALRQSHGKKMTNNKSSKTVSMSGRSSYSRLLSAPLAKQYSNSSLSKSNNNNNININSQRGVAFGSSSSLAKDGSYRSNGTTSNDSNDHDSNKENDNNEEDDFLNDGLLLFSSLRDEFILDRSLHPPSPPQDVRSAFASEL
jgi:hypothetical protein